MKTDNSELLTARDIRRDITGALDRLNNGETDKLVVMKSNQFVAVFISVEEYERLTEGGDEDVGEPAELPT